MKMFTDFYHTVKELPPDITFHYISDTSLILYERAVIPTTIMTKLNNIWGTSEHNKRHVTIFTTSRVVSETW